MATEYKPPTALETLSADYWFPKFVMSSLLLFATFSFFNREYPLSGIVCVLFLTMSFAMMSLTRIKPEAEVVKYRRFFQWRPIPYSEIPKCGQFWILGFIRAKEYISPWGKIYFMLPRDRQYDYRWDREIITFIRSKASLFRPQQH
jgi:hypothetical protein